MLYEKCINQGFTKAYTSYAFFLMENCNEKNEAMNYFKLASENLCFKAMNELAS